MKSTLISSIEKPCAAKAEYTPVFNTATPAA